MDGADGEFEMELFMENVNSGPLQTLYPQLLMDPGRFLSQHLVVPGGFSTTGSSMQRFFEMSDKPGYPGAYIIRPLQKDRLAGSYLFSAAYLKMEPMTAEEMGTVNGVSASKDFEIAPAKIFKLNPPDNSSKTTKHLLMITGQLTGCTVCWRRTGTDGAVLIAHLQPRPADFMGRQLESDVLRHGLLRGKRVEAAYGRREYGETPASAHFFGVWHPNEDRWRFFAQKRSSGDVHTSEGPGSVEEILY